MFGIPHDVLGTIPGWITSAGVLALLTLMSKHYLAARKLQQEGSAIGQAQSDARDADIRDHYADEVRQLRDKLDKQNDQFRADLNELESRYRRALDESEKRHQQCMDDRDILRQRVTLLEDELRGLIRVITQASIDRVLMIHEELPQDIREAAARVEAIITERGRE